MFNSLHSTSGRIMGCMIIRLAMLYFDGDEKNPTFFFLTFTVRLTLAD